MTTTFIAGFQSEWLKKRRSLAVWLVLIGSLFTPAVTLLIALTHRDKLPKQYADANFWSSYWMQCWQPMTFVLLPLGIVLATSLVLQLEFKNNTWKQVHATPQSYSTIFFAKFVVLLVMMGQLFLLFNVFTFTTAWVPPLFFAEVAFPEGRVPWRQLLEDNVSIFVLSMPILTLQYLLSLHFKNFLIPVGAGMVIWLLGTLALSWKYSFIFPYLYTAFYQLVAQGAQLHSAVPNVHMLAIGYSILFTAIAYGLYITKSDKG
jgi:lantibiotic transport system permease protein